MFHKAQVMQHLQANLKYNMKNIQTGADNLARSRIPGEREKTLAPYSFSDYVTNHNSGLRTTHAAHIPAHGTSGSGGRISSQKDTTEVGPNGNNIDTERQLQNINESTIAMQENIKTYEKLWSSWTQFVTFGGR